MGCGGSGLAAASSASPVGVAVRYSGCPEPSRTQPPRTQPPSHACGPWHDVTELDDGRVAITVGRSADETFPAGLGAQITGVFRETGDPLAALAAAPTAANDLTALSAVIDRSAARLTYSSVGDLRPALAGPDAAPALLESAVGRLRTAQLSPAATVLLCSAAADHAAALLGRCVSLHPDQAADRIIESLPVSSAPMAAVLYRQPPSPLRLTVPADPTNLATVRHHLRGWLALTGVDSETSADALLAVGEAASNTTEHAAAGAVHGVDLTVTAAFADGRLRFTVSDNGCWKPPPDLPGNRGHGIRLIHALVDDVDLIATTQGTTVNMVKEVRR